MNNEIEDYSLSEIFAQAKAIQEKKATDAEKLPALFDKVLDALVDTSEKLNALTARHRELQYLVTSEIADFFAGQEQPGEAVGAEAQHKALMARVVACFDGMPAANFDAVVSYSPPTLCRDEIYKNGKVVTVFDCGMLAMEGLVKEASRKGVEMDWHYFGGRAVVKTLGDVDAARENLERSIPRLLNI